MNAVPTERQVQRSPRTPRETIDALTPLIIAECARGRSQQNVADRFGLAVNTVRALLKRHDALPSTEATRRKRSANLAAGRLLRRKKHIGERYAEKVIIRDGECWGWTGSKDRHGYPQLYFEGGKRLASHVSLELTGKPRPSADLCALHTCDNPECTNPEHLWWGTRSENTQDAISKGRLKPFQRKAGR